MLGLMRLLAAFAFTPTLFTSNAAADGETSPMLGGSVIAGTSTQESANMAGVELEAAWWYGRLGVAVEMSARVPVEEEAARTVALGGSLRLRLMQGLVPSLLEPSDVELAVELQGIVERTWWDGELTDREPYRRGLGLALRFRGSTDDDVPRLITESRFFVRVYTWRSIEDAVLARGTQPPAADTQEMIVVFGIGAAFGGGEASYLQQFRRRSFDSSILRRTRVD